jgi:hypothetical protein
MSTPLRERPDAPLGTLIFRAGLLPAETIESALEEGVKTGKRLGEILTERGLISEVDLARLLAGQKGLEFVTLREQIVDPSAAGLFTEEQARLFRALPYAFDGELPVVAIADPTDDVLIRNVREALGREDARFVVTARTELADIAADVYSRPLEPAPAVEPEQASASESAHMNGHAPDDAELAVEPQAEPEPDAAPTDFEAGPAQPEAVGYQPPVETVDETEAPPEPVQAEPVPEPVAEFAPPEPAAPTPSPEPAPVVETMHEPPTADEPPVVVEGEALSEVPAQPEPSPAAENPAAPEPLRVSETSAQPEPAFVHEPVPVEPEPTAPEPVAAEAVTAEPMATEPIPFPHPAPAPPPAPYPPAATQPVAEPPRGPEPALEPVGEQGIVTEPPAAPAPAAVPWRMTIRLTNGERVDAGEFSDEASAKQEAKAIMMQIAAADQDDWPFVNGRFLKPDTIVSVDIAEHDGDEA